MRLRIHTFIAKYTEEPSKSGSVAQAIRHNRSKFKIPVSVVSTLFLRQTVNIFQKS